MMKPRRILIPSLLLVLYLLGCNTPQDRWATARIALSGTQNTLVSLNKAGVLSDEDFVATEKSDAAARAALEKAEKELPGGPSFTFWIEIVEDAIDNLSPGNLKKISSK